MTIIEIVPHEPKSYTFRKPDWWAKEVAGEFKYTYCQICGEEADQNVGTKQTPLCKKHEKITRIMAGIE